MKYRGDPETTAGLMLSPPGATLGTEHVGTADEPEGKPRWLIPEEAHRRELDPRGSDVERKASNELTRTSEWTSPALTNEVFGLRRACVA